MTARRRLGLATSFFAAILTIGSDAAAQALPGTEEPAEAERATPAPGERATVEATPEAPEADASGQLPPTTAEGVPGPETAPSVEPAVEPEGQENPLLPPGESERMGKHPVRLDSLTYKPGTGLVARSQDGAFSMGIALRAQFRYTVVDPPDADAEQSFQIRRARLTFKGNVFGEHNKYKTELAVSPRDMSMDRPDDGSVGTSSLLDWYFDFDHLRDATLRVGQYKVPFSRQRVISSGDLQLVDRAITNREFNVDRDIGVDLRSEDFLGLDLLRYYAYVGVGEGRNTFAESDFGMMYIARVEVLPLGLFEDYDEPDFERTGPRLSIGAAYAFVDDAKGNRGILGSAPADGGTTDYHNVNVDAMFKLWGLSVLSEFYYRTGQRDPGPLVGTPEDPTDPTSPLIGVEPSRDGIGWLAQAGYLLPRTRFEVAARYAMLRGSTDPGSDGLSDEDELGGGLSYYFAHHRLKLQGDYFRTAEDGDFGDGENRVRVQLQAAY